MRNRPSMVLCLATVFLTVVFSGCNKTASNESKSIDKAPTPKEVSSSADVVRVRATVDKISVTGKAEAIVLLTISPSYHVNANPATFSYLIPTEVTATNAEGITTDKPEYPVGEKKRFQFAKEPLSVYEGEVKITLPLSVSANTAKGSHSLPIKVRVQACDAEKCYPPDTLSAALAVEVK